MKENFVILTRSKPSGLIGHTRELLLIPNSVSFPANNWNVGGFWAGRFDVLA
jgi:hypothetical protein